MNYRLIAWLLILMATTLILIGIYLILNATGISVYLGMGIVILNIVNVIVNICTITG